MEMFSPVALNADDTLLGSKQPTSSVLLSFQPRPANVEHENEVEAGSEQVSSLLLTTTCTEGDSGRGVP